MDKTKEQEGGGLSFVLCNYVLYSFAQGIEASLFLQSEHDGENCKVLCYPVGMHCNGTRNKTMIAFNKTVFYASSFQLTRKRTGLVLLPIALALMLIALAAPLRAFSGIAFASECTHAHTYTVNETIVEATCTQAGEYKVHTICEDCSEEIAVSEPLQSNPKGHDWEVTPGTPATCENEGLSAYRQCKRCGEEEGGEVLPALGHNYVWNGKDAEFKDNGSRITQIGFKVVCSHDASHVKNVYYYGSGQYAKAPTCTDEGRYAYIMFNDDDNYFGGGLWYAYDKDGTFVFTQNRNDIIIPALGHTWENIEGKSPTCEEDGYTAYKHCTVCGEDEGKDVIEKTGHTWGTTPINISFEFDPGNLRYGHVYFYLVCENDPTHTKYCREQLSQAWNPREPSCQDTGCPRCAFFYDVYAYIDDSYWYVYEAEDGTCYLTKDVWDYIIPSLGHDIQHTDEYISSHADATCTAEGHTTYQCSRCTYTETETLEKLPHTWTITSVSDLTTGSGGKKTFTVVATCNGCAEARTTEYSFLQFFPKVEPTYDRTGSYPFAYIEDTEGYFPNSGLSYFYVIDRNGTLMISCDYEKDVVIPMLDEDVDAGFGTSVASEALREAPKASSDNTVKLASEANQATRLAQTGDTTGVLACALAGLLALSVLVSGLALRAKQGK